MLNITNKPITIIGGGKVAYRKAKTLLAFGGKVTVIAPCFYESFESIKDEAVIEERSLNHVEDSLRESFIVIAATDNRELNERIGKFCDTHNMLCNVIDNKQLSSFIVPAYMKRGDLIISISTNGKSPSLTKKIKEELETTYDVSYGPYVDALGRIRDQVLAQVTDEAEKRHILYRILEMNLEELEAYEKSHFND